ncbi:MAG: hypothetical protein XXXJIFNMEKO3_01298 [Candidatus Erwinia impunctatus]|nr:hypothetical protein XXXJIFNMEKO_01298 [Culicoides impunctatus]
MTLEKLFTPLKVGAITAPNCSGQLILATRPDCSWNSRSDSFGVKPPLYQWGRMAL